MTAPNLADQVEALAGELGKYRITHRVIIGLVISVVFDIALSIACLALGLALNSSNDHLASNQARQDCTAKQRQALTALSTADQDANRQFYTDVFSGKSEADVFTAKDKLYATWDADKVLRSRIVANNAPVSFTIAENDISFPRPVSFTVQPCR